MPKIAVIYFSLYGHTLAMSEVAVTAAKEAGAEVTLYQVPETLSAEVLEKMHAAPKRQDVPDITPDDLKLYDGYIFVIPTRYGRAVAQFSALFDYTGGLWMQQALGGKFATIISSTGTQNGGQETTALTTIPFLAHHGIMFVPIGYAAPETTNLTEIKGGGPFGAGTLAGADGSRQPSVLELNAVAFQAKHFTSIVTQYRRGGERLKGEAEIGKVSAIPAQLVEETHSKEPSGSSSGAPPSAGSDTSEKKKKKGIWKSLKKRLSMNG